MQLPQAFELRMKDMLGDSYPAFLREYEKKRTFGLRVNTSKISVEDFERIAPFHLKRIPWTENGFFYEEADQPSKHPYYFAGLYYLQEPSAMTPASRLPVTPGERVLDLCAAPGGKATELGVRLKGQGLLVANDISGPRMKGLLKNMEVFGIPNIFLTNEDPANLSRNFPDYFDKILVDAPCSGEGMFRKEPAVMEAWTEDKPQMCAGMQRKILPEAVKMLKEGGLLLYSTCTFAPVENEGSISYLLENYPELHLLDLLPYEGFAPGHPEWGNGTEALKKCVRIWPHIMNGEGHFLALLQKGEVREPAENAGSIQREAVPADILTVSPSAKDTFRENDSSGIAEDTGKHKKGKKNRKGKNKQEITGSKTAGKKGRGAAGTLSGNSADLTDFRKFFRDIRWNISPEQLDFRNGFVYLVPELPPVKGLKFVRNGLLLGEIRKNRFEPSQALAMALKREDYISSLNLSAGDDRVERYLKGETLTVEDDECELPGGWQLVCVDGYPLGWGKLVNHTLKNKYMTAWRKN